MLFDFNKALRTTLKNSQVFAGLNDAHIKLIMANGTKQKFQKDDLIIREGQKVRCLYLVVGGQLEVMLDEQLAKSGVKRFSEIKLNTLEQGDCFGEYSLIDQQPVSANIKVIESGTLFRISCFDFEEIIAANDLLAKIIYKNLLELLVRRLREKDQTLDNILLVV